MCDYIYDNYGKIFHSISQTGSFSHNLNEFALLFRVILLSFDIDICIICRILTFDLKFTVGDTIQPSACIVVIHSMIPFPVIFDFRLSLFCLLNSFSSHVVSALKVHYQNAYLHTKNISTVPYSFCQHCVNLRINI